MSHAPLVESIARLEDDTSRPPDVRFEEMVAELLRSVRVAVDRYLPEGLEADMILPHGLPGVTNIPTLVEVLYAKDVGSLSARVQHELARFIEAVETAVVAQATAFLVVLSSDLPSHLHGRLQTQAENAPGNTSFYVWGPQELAEYLLKHDSDALGSATTPEALAMSRAANEPTETDWRAQRARYLSQLARTYQSTGVVLILGAGVSIPMGAPSWSQLLHSLLLEAVTAMMSGPTPSLSPAQAHDVVSELLGLVDTSPLQTARYLRNSLGEAFEGALTSALYRGMGTGDGDSASKTADSLLLEVLANLCEVQGGKPRVKAVINYNFDDLFETALDSIGVLAQPISSGHVRVLPGHLPVYHVHGFLPKPGRLYSSALDSLIVFSEERYHGLYNEPYHWTNVAQLRHMMNTTCVIVGHSLTDPNLRRLLEIARATEGSERHFAFLPRQPVEGVVREAGLEANVARAIARTHHMIRESAFDELGVTILWLDSFGELPDLLAGLAVENAREAG